MYHDEQPAKHAIQLRFRDGALYETDEINRAYDPLHFVLPFPTGDDGWQPGLLRLDSPGEPATAARAQNGDAMDGLQGGLPTAHLRRRLLKRTGIQRRQNDGVHQKPNLRLATRRS